MDVVSSNLIARSNLLWASFVRASDLFDLPDSLPFSNSFCSTDPPWVWIPRIAEALATGEFGKSGQCLETPAGVSISGRVFLHETVRLPPYCVISGPAYIGAGTEIRPGAFIRGNVIVGEECVLGTSCEYKNCLLMDRVATPHFNYVGDSILGNGSHLGAGVVLANVRLDRRPVKVHTPDEWFETGLAKLGALIGDGAEVGCNAVLQPGTILAKRSLVFPTVAYGGFLGADKKARR